MPIHILKCEKNYNGPKLESCPFNSMHMMTAAELEEHKLKCPDYLANYDLDMEEDGK